jgi:nucleoside-diphosphate-sugar epimerase
MRSLFRALSGGRRAIVLSALVIVLSFSLMYTLTITMNGRIPTSSARSWGKSSSGSLLSQLYEYTTEVQVPLKDQRSRKDPCLDVALPEGGTLPVPVKGTLVLITGGAGFIGSNLADRLLELGYRVRIFDNLYTGFIRNVPLHRKNLEFMYGDILDPQVLKRAVKNVEFVFHLAAMSKVVPSLKDPEMARFCTENNALGTWNVLNATRAETNMKKVVYAGSSTYYGNRPIPHQEDMAPDFLTPYAASKYEGEMQMQMFDNVFNIPTITNRFFMVYGPRQPTTGAYAIVTGVFARQAAKDLPLTIEGDGSHFRDFIHVSDIVNGLILSQQAEDLRGGFPINLGSGTYFSVQDVANIVSKNQVHVADRKKDLVGTLADTCRMKHLLNYKTQKDFHSEMDHMAKETMKGNVFAQEWLTPLHALSAPHIVPVGSPIIPWPASGEVEGILSAYKQYERHADEAHHSTDVVLQKTISVIFFGGAEDDVAPQSRLLRQTVFSLVRFGGARRYLVMATGSYLGACQEMNLPCVQATAANSTSVIAKVAKEYQRIHICRAGTTYIMPLSPAFVEDGNEEIRAVSNNDDIFVTLGERTRAVINTLAQAASKEVGEVAEDPHNPNVPILNLDKWTTQDPHLNVTQLEINTSCPNAAEDHERIASSCPSERFVRPRCENVNSAKDIITALKANDLWLLSECTNGNYCDAQQSVPLRWLQQPPDLSTAGSWCST